MKDWDREKEPFVTMVEYIDRRSDEYEVQVFPGATIEKAVEKALTYAITIGGNVSRVKLAKATSATHARTFRDLRFYGPPDLDNVVQQLAALALVDPAEADIYEIPLHRMPELQERIEKLGKVAAKLKLAPIELQIVGERSEPILDPKTRKPTGEVRVFALVRFSGEAPRIAGHRFIARIEHTEAGNIVSKAPGAEDAEIPKSVRTAEPTCDHCGLRRDRKDTFLLEHISDHKLVRVGRSCLQDYLRSEDVANVLKMWSLLQELESFADGASDEGGGGGGGGVHYLELQKYLAHVSRAIHVVGWVSGAQARERNMTSTASVAGFSCGKKPSYGEGEKEWLELQPSEADYSEADEVIAWARALKPTSDYEENLHVALSLDYVKPRNEGLVASAVVAWRKVMEKEIERRRKAEKPPSAHFGGVGRKYVRAVEVTHQHDIEGVYGTTRLYSFGDDEGHVFKWFASSLPRIEPHNYEDDKILKVGDRVLLYFSIKKHDQYKGEAQTVITRATARALDDPAPMKWVGPDGEIFASKKAMASGEAPKRKASSKTAEQLQQEHDDREYERRRELDARGYEY